MTPGSPSGAGASIALGIDIGGTKVLGVAIDRDDRVVAEARVATPHAATDPDHREAAAVGAEVAEAVADVVAALRRAVGGSSPSGGPAGEPPIGEWPVGAGAPGLVDRDGVLRFSPNLPGAAGADLRRLLADRLPGAALVVENDANCAAIAEHRLGAAQGADHALVVILGTGIGAGLVVGGRLVSGRSGFAGEAGHMIVDPTGPPCPCGQRGCWERYASGGGLGRLAREAAYAGRLPEVVGSAGGDPELVRGEDVTRAALDGDAGALAVMDDLGWWVALGLANLTALFDPDRIVLGGGLAGAGELLLAPTRRAFAGLVEGGDARPAVPIVPAAFGERAGAIGAALAARGGGLW
ncbi:MAG TPA: ROK family protein [Acidimicrobiales bacterium]